MKNYATTIVFALLIATGEILCASVNSTPPTLPNFSIALPVEAIVVDDLDARDEFNRPIQSSAVRSQFQNLWLLSLNQKILNSLTPLRLQMLALLNSVWDGFAGMIRVPFSVARTWLRSWMSSKKFRLSIPVQVQLFSMGHFSQTLPLWESGNSFLYLICSLLSSTRLLR